MCDNVPTEKIRVDFDHKEIGDWNACFDVDRRTTVADVCEEYLKEVGRRSRRPYYKDVVLNKPIDFTRTIGELYDEQMVEKAKGNGPVHWKWKQVSIEVVEAVDFRLELIGLTWSGSVREGWNARPEATLGSVLDGIDWFQRLNPLDCHISINGAETVLSPDVLDRQMRNLRPESPRKKYNQVRVDIVPDPASFSLALMMGAHERLGQDFVLSPLSQDVLRMVCSMVERTREV
jgi:hypothetical protein